MPRIVNDDHWLGGFITAMMDELQRMLNRLASPTTFSRDEIINMRETINSNDATVRAQHRAMNDMRLRPKMNMYEAVLNLAMTELGRREENRGKPVSESPAMAARRLRQPDLDMYASDGRHEVPLEYWTTVKSVPALQPGSVTDLRQIIDNRRNNRDSGDFRPVGAPLRERNEITDNWDDPIAGPSSSAAVQRRHETIRAIAVGRLDEERASSARSRSERDVSPMSAASRGSRMSYTSSAQSVCSGPLKNVAYPPMADWCPIPLSRDDPNLIGRSEIYVRPSQRTQIETCPACDGNHPMFKCDTMKEPDMRERWYVALSVGVCLFCLRLGHSSFSCWRLGQCRRCGTRHNSVLCPTLAKNRLVFKKVKKIVDGRRESE